jgi:hypothetical protein
VVSIGLLIALLSTAAIGEYDHVSAYGPAPATISGIPHTLKLGHGYVGRLAANSNAHYRFNDSSGNVILGGTGKQVVVYAFRHGPYWLHIEVGGDNSPNTQVASWIGVVK